MKVGGVDELVPCLRNKTIYVVHYGNLQLYLSLGMKFIKTHKMLRFRQFDWLKKYIDFNTNKRKNAVNSSEKGFLSQ